MEAMICDELSESTTVRPAPASKRRTRRLRLLGVAVCLALVSACSSGSDSDGGQAATDDPVTAPADGPDGDRGADPGGDGEVVPVCDLVEPVVDDLVAAFGVGIPVTDEGAYARGEGECFIDFSDESVPAGELSEAHIWVKRLPAIHSEVDAAADTVGIGEPSPAPEVADDALVFDDGSMGIVLFAVGDRVYEVSASYPYDDTGAGATPIADAVVAVAQVVHPAISG